MSHYTIIADEGILVFSSVLKFNSHDVILIGFTYGTGQETEVNTFDITQNKITNKESFIVCLNKHLYPLDVLSSEFEKLYDYLQINQD
jgi:hypothetical protein